MNKQNPSNHSKGSPKDSKGKQKHSKETAKDSKNTSNPSKSRQKHSKDKLNKTKSVPTPSPSKLESYNPLPEKSTSHHDKFFKRVFSHIPFAKEIVRLILSKEELKQCNLSSLKVEKSPLKTKGKKMDLVLSFSLKDFPKKQIKIVILFEHKSKYDKNLFKQVLGYQTNLYEESKEVILVIPVLFYHGKLPWNSQLSFQEAFLGEFFSKIPPTFRKRYVKLQIKVAGYKR